MSDRPVARPLAYTGQHNTESPRTNIHAISGTRNRDPVYKRSRPLPQTARRLHWPSSLFKFGTSEGIVWEKTLCPTPPVPLTAVRTAALTPRNEICVLMWIFCRWCYCLLWEIIPQWMTQSLHTNSQNLSPNFTSQNSLLLELWTVVNLYTFKWNNFVAVWTYESINSDLFRWPF
jgi:hypothetical protein